MKTLIAMALVGFAASAAHAGSTPVVITIYGPVPPPHYLFNDTGPVAATPTGVTINGSESTAVAATMTAGGPVGQNGVGAGAQDDVYARLLEEAKKRGLR